MLRHHDPQHGRGSPDQPDGDIAAPQKGHPLHQRPLLLTQHQGSQSTINGHEADQQTMGHGQAAQVRRQGGRIDHKPQVGNQGGKQQSGHPHPGCHQGQYRQLGCTGIDRKRHPEGRQPLHPHLDHGNAGGYPPGSNAEQGWHDRPGPFPESGLPNGMVAARLFSGSAAHLGPRP